MKKYRCVWKTAFGDCGYTTCWLKNIQHHVFYYEHEAYEIVGDKK